MSQDTSIVLDASASLGTVDELVDPIRVAIELGAKIPVIEGSIAYLAYLTHVPMLKSEEYEVEVLGIYSTRESALATTRDWLVRFWDSAEDSQFQPWYYDETLLEMSGNEDEYPSLYAQARTRFLETKTDEEIIEYCFGPNNVRGDQCKIQEIRVQ